MIFHIKNNGTEKGWYCLICIYTLVNTLTMTLSRLSLTNLSGITAYSLPVWYIFWISLFGSLRKMYIFYSWFSLGRLYFSNIRRRKKLYINAYLWTLVKGYRWTYLQGRKRDTRASLVAQMVKNLPAVWETWVQSLVRSPGEGNGNPLQYSCLENSVDWVA